MNKCEWRRDVQSTLDWFDDLETQSSMPCHPKVWDAQSLQDWINNTPWYDKPDPEWVSFLEGVRDIKIKQVKDKLCRMCHSVKNFFAVLECCDIRWYCLDCCIRSSIVVQSCMGCRHPEDKTVSNIFVSEYVHIWWNEFFDEHPNYALGNDAERYNGEHCRGHWRCCKHHFQGKNVDEKTKTPYPQTPYLGMTVEGTYFHHSILGTEREKI